MNTELDLNVYLSGKQLSVSPDGFQRLMLYENDYYVVYSDTSGDNISAMCITDIVDEEECARIYESMKDTITTHKMTFVKDDSDEDYVSYKCDDIVIDIGKKTYVNDLGDGVKSTHVYNDHCNVMNGEVTSNQSDFEIIDEIVDEMLEDW